MRPELTWSNFCWAALAALLGSSGCTSPAERSAPVDHSEPVSRVSSALGTPSCSTTYSLAGGTVTGSTPNGTFSSCTFGTNTSGATCSVTGGALTYTAGSTVGYFIVPQRGANGGTYTNGTYLQSFNTGGFNYVEPGGAAGASTLWALASTGSGFTFQLAGSANSYVYMPTGTESSGNDLVANTTAANAAVFTMTDCNGTGDPGLYNRFGFMSASGSSPYWKIQSSSTPGGYIRTVGGGNGTPCSPTSTGAWEAFYLIPGWDTFTIQDTSGATAVCTVSVENPVALLPSSISLPTGASIAAQSGNVNTVQAWGGSGIFTGGSAGCAVTTNASGSSGTCTVTGSGQVSYTAGNTGGTDTLTITDNQGHTGTLTVVVSAPWSVSSTSSYALASSGLGSTVSVSGGTGPYTCTVSSSTSGGSTCSVSGGTLTYTAGATAGYNIESVRTSDYLQIVSSGGYNYVETGGAVGSSAQLWKMAASGSGFTFQSAGNANPAGTLAYIRSSGTAGNDLVADTTAAGAAIYTRQDCNGTGDPGQYNRFGFQSATGSAPYWQTKTSSPSVVDAVNNGNGTACSPTSGGPWEGYFLNSGTDTLTIADSAGHQTIVTVSVENPVSIMPSPIAVAEGTAVSGAFAWGGSGVFTGGSAGCSVTTNASGSSGTCSVSGSGAIAYTAGPTAGTDVLAITDSQGHGATVDVVVGGSVLTVGTGTNPIDSVVPRASVVLTTDGTGATWTLVNNNSGGTLNPTTGAYTAGSTGDVSDLAQVTQNGVTSTVVISVGPGVSVVPPQAGVQPSQSKSFVASGGSGTFSSCALTANASGGTCSVTSAGAVTYTAGATSGSDVMTVTDSLGNFANVTVVVSCAADSSLQILYPYNKTVFPLAMLPPVVQWSDNGTSPYAKVSLTYPATGTPTFSWSEIVPENGPLSTPYNMLPTALPVSGGGRAQIPSIVWTTLQNAASGADALLSVQALEASQGTSPTTITIHFATAPLKGTIYYESYDTNLVSNAAPNGATLAITVGASTPTVVDGNTGCRECHSVSASGNVMVVNDGTVTNPALYAGSLSVALPSNTETVIPSSSPSANDGRFSWAALSPDGTVMFTNEGSSPTWMSGQWATNPTAVAQLPSGVYSVSTGAALATSGLAAGFQARFPTFATDTTALAFNYESYDNVSLAMMSASQSGGTWTFGTPTVLFTPPTPPAGYPNHSGAVAWPSFMPAGQGGVVVQNQVANGCTEPGADDSSCAPGTCSDVRHNIGALGELWWVNTSSTPVPTRLSNANGAGYLPLGYNGHGLAGTTVPAVSADPTDTAGGIPTAAQLSATGAGSCQTALGSIFGNGNDALYNYKPTVNPQVTGGYQWVVFTSRRMYGNVATINPFASDPRETTEITSTATPQYPETKKLWVAAMKTNPAPGSDPSYPAFYLDGQELYAGNSRSYWVLPQCVPAVSGGITETALSRSGWVPTASGSGGGDVPANAIDGSSSTRWSTGAFQTPGQWFQLDMQSPQTFNQITMDSASSTNDYARGYQVLVSSDGMTWSTPIATGTGTGALVTVSFPTQTSRYVRIVQTGSTDTGTCNSNPAPCYWWSIAEINVANTMSTNTCTSTQDCCQTTPTTCKLDIPITTDPPAEHCVANSSITCSADGGSCNVDGDCCNYVTEGTRCSGGTCQVPPAASSPGYPNSATVTYDFQSNCGLADGGVNSGAGTAAIWRYLQTDQIIPTGTSISFTVQSASTEAGLSAAPTASAGTTTTTIQSPLYWTGPTTVDQELRALNPPSVSSTWLRVNVTLQPSSDKTSAPTLISLTPTFDCAPAE